MQNTERDLREILGDFLRRRTDSSKDLARLINSDPRTAEGFRAGRYWPNARHWRLIVQHFGRDVLAAVFDPEIDPVAARLARERRELEERLHEIQARQRQVMGDLDGPSERVAAAEDRALADANLDLFETISQHPQPTGEPR